MARDAGDEALRVALISPHPWPPRDDVAHQVAAEGRALARRGHRVTILAPATRRDLVAAGRTRLRALQTGDPDAVCPEPGEVLEVAVGRALPTGTGRRVGEPFDLLATLENVLSRAPFDVVHLHEPLAPSPALAALRHARGVTATTFHRSEPLAGVAFLRPLVDRAVARADLRIATTEAARRALSKILPGDYALVPAGVDPDMFRPGPADGSPPGLVLVARERDRVGVRFALGVLRALDLTGVGPVTLLGPPDAPWRTRAAVPKALRDRVEVVPDAGPAARAQVLAGSRIALIATPEDAEGPVLREAMASGCAVLAPRCAATDEGASDGADALLLPPFSRDAWAEGVTALVAEPARRAELSTAAVARARDRPWDAVAADLEGAYLAALHTTRIRPEGAAPRILADLCVRPGRHLSADAVVAACGEAGIEAVAVVSQDGLAPGRAVAAAGPPGLTVIVGQEVATTDGALIGLYLSHPVAAGVSPADAAAAIRAQGGLVMVPHPDDGAPSAGSLRDIAGMVDCHAAMTPGHRTPPAAVGAMRRAGLLVCAGSGATRPHEVGAAVTELRRFDGPADLLDALEGAELRRGSAREPRSRRRRRRSPKS